jgi:hypothetical protein
MDKEEDRRKDEEKERREDEKEQLKSAILFSNRDRARRPRTSAQVLLTIKRDFALLPFVCNTEISKFHHFKIVLK